MTDQLWEERFRQQYVCPDGQMVLLEDEVNDLIDFINHLLKERDEEHKLLMARSNEWWNQKLTDLKTKLGKGE